MTTQRLTIPNWLPDQMANSSHGHWATKQKELQAAQTMVWASAKQAGFQPVVGRARLTITLVFPVKRRRDQDGLYSRVKGCVDGLVRGGWLPDDNIDVLELVVRAETRKGERATVVELEQLV